MKNLIKKIIINLILTIIFLGISFLLLYIICYIGNFILTHSWAFAILIIIDIIGLIKLLSEAN